MRDHDVLEGVDSAAVLFDLVGEHIACLFHLGKMHEVGDQVAEIFDTVVKFGADRGEGIGIQIGLVPFFDLNGRNHDAHDIGFSGSEFEIESGHSHRFFQHLRGSNGTGE